MGWWPFSNSSGSAPADTTSIPTTSTTPSIPTSTPTTSSQTQAPLPPSSTTTSTTQQDDEFHAAFPHLAPPTTSPTSPSDSASSTSTSTSPYPTKMSCTAAFDAAFYCSSLGGHFNDIYRYGELRSCSDHWRDWRFCMGLNVYGKARQEEMIANHYKEKEDKVRGKPNSEDIWDRRGDDERIERPFGRAEEEARRVEG
ncbi:hypothetical protein BU24DRAFT_428762 [Aaosphaeria arxii CBS 175.79]|uniref:DUF3128 domain-containing protein n=1 Tax=Aaosphaeria arxii CBS 175.79 TaxID=1450172 RepID=A0A6A5X8I3_9PLEO|nr:uncharacterized protein BU24DRAFT_428762 [Aaosphaeria arxii CBS 175.79]KAF2009221.1 hypothetical protein BU24DRAFT_428762 [Aaosphaeria arxii CBS 175.79]